jgi:aryl-alcohol dehydrogenase-like predicted oxidoreductase
MEYRVLGRSGLKVSVLALGTMGFGGKGGFSRVGTLGAEDARRQIDRCLDAGVNLIDTADIYSAGSSEEIVGQAIAGRRDRLLLATKARFAMGAGPNDRGLSRHHIIRGVEASLQRLGIDHIDLYQVHEWDGLTPLEETLEALDTLVRSGKVRYVGCSNYSGWHLMKALAVSDTCGYQRFVSQQIYYTLLGREAEYELVPISIDQGVGILVWSPLAGGLLSGKYRREVKPQGEARHLTDWGEPPVRDWEQAYNVIEAVVRVAEAHGVSAPEVALAYLLRKPGVASVIVGTRNDQQLEANLKAVDLHLSDSDIAELEAVSRPPLLYPYWHQANTAADRLGPADLSLLGSYIQPG